MTELKGLRIQSIDDIQRIRQSNLAEREFARLLIDNTNLEVEYEPVSFVFVDSDGNSQVTVPDFRVTNPQTGAVNYIEITTSRNGKHRQRRVMENAGPQGRYKVFYREKLEAIQARFPTYNLVPNIETNIAK